MQVVEFTREDGSDIFLTVQTVWTFFEACYIDIWYPPGLSTSFGVNMPARVFRAMGTVPMHPEY